MNLPALALCAALVAATGAYSAQVRVIDGDTIAVAGETVRIENVDAPEMPGRAKCAVEARKALEAKAALERLVASGTVTLRRNVKRPKDRYGRTLAVVLVDGKDVAQPLIAQGVVRPWKGKSSSWCG